jgi:hypothetical protein
LEKNETISQSLFIIFNCKEKITNADVSLDQNPQGIHLEEELLLITPAFSLF